MIEAVDSFFEYVSSRMATINPKRQVVMVMDASDWPPKNIVMEAFYLLTLDEKPIIGKSFWSATIPVVMHTLQWTWIVQGADLTQGKIGRNRGDRYRTAFTMKGELLKAMYPWFCLKQSWAAVGTTPSGVVLQGTPTNPQESIWWNQPTFLNRTDRESGIVTGTATVQLGDMTEAILA
jgi:hypothetical protein